VLTLAANIKNTNDTTASGLLVAKESSAISLGFCYSAHESTSGLNKIDAKKRPASYNDFIISIVVRHVWGSDNRAGEVHNNAPSSYSQSQMGHRKCGSASDHVEGSGAKWKQFHTTICACLHMHFNMAILCTVKGIKPPIHILVFGPALGKVGELVLHQIQVR
jgi:hypothetical protein